MAVISFKCPNCDGELIFDPETQKYKCEYCGSKFTQAELDALQPAESEETDAGAADGSDAAEQETTEQQSADTKKKEGEDGGAEAVIYNCPSCGAEIVTDATTAATFCYYCHNPVVLGKRLEGKYLPNKVIPFKISKKEAEKRFLEYVGKKKFVPKAFFNKKQIECLSGVYFPYWIYDAKLQGKLQGEGKKIRVWRTGDTEYTETKFYHVEREGEVNLKNLAENALQKANVQLVKGVLPYQFNEMKDFNMGYLSGFMAEKRDIEQKAVEGNMQATMKNSAEKLMRESVQGYNALSVNSFGVIPKKEDWSYALLPVWTVTYKGKDGKIYYYSMNGQTGKVFGELPVDYGKVTLTGIISAVVVLIIALIGGYFL